MWAIKKKTLIDVENIIYQIFSFNIECKQKNKKNLSIMIDIYD